MSSIQANLHAIKLYFVSSKFNGRYLFNILRFIIVERTQNNIFNPTVISLLTHAQYVKSWCLYIVMNTNFGWKLPPEIIFR